MQVEVFVTVKLKALHSLEEREAPHQHIWRVTAGITGRRKEGRVVSLPLFRARLEEVLKPLQGTNLNQNRTLNAETRKNPTCENLCFYLREVFDQAVQKYLADPDLGIRLASIEVAVDEMSGEETGFARLRLA